MNCPKCGRPHRCGAIRFKSWKHLTPHQCRICGFQWAEIDGQMLDAGTRLPLIVV